MPLGRSRRFEKLHNEELHEDEMGRAFSINGEKRNAYRLLVGKPEGKTPLGRPRHRCVGNIKMGLGEKGWDGVDWINLVPVGTSVGAL
jgi:hypothetical protein